VAEVMRSLVVDSIR
jgi:hypothetical protein